LRPGHVHVFRYRQSIVHLDADRRTGSYRQDLRHHTSQPSIFWMSTSTVEEIVYGPPAVLQSPIVINDHEATIRHTIIEVGQRVHRRGSISAEEGKVLSSTSAVRARVPA
jgi:hypothetical protein